MKEYSRKIEYMENLQQQDGSPLFVTPKRSIKRKKAVSDNFKSKGVFEIDKSKPKARTPSGQVINTSVKDIRNFFTSENLSTTASLIKFGQSQPAIGLQAAMRENTSSLVTDHLSWQSDSDLESNQGEWNVVKGFKGVKLNDRFGDLSAQANQNKQLKALSSENRYAYLMPDQSSMDESENEREMPLQHDCDLQSKGKQSYSKEVQYEVRRDGNASLFNTQRSNVSEENKSAELEETRSITPSAENKNQSLKSSDMKKDKKVSGAGKKDQNPQLMDVQIVMQMFGELKKELKVISDGNAVRDTTIANVESSKIAETQEVTDLKNELKNCKRKNDILSGVVEHLGNLCVDIDKRLEQVESRNTRRHIVFTGLITDNNLKKCTEQILSYCQEKLRYEIEILDCFKMGIGPSKPVVVMVPSMSQKYEIFQAMDEYRKRCEEREQNVTVYINDFLPAEVKERRRRERDIMRINAQQQSTKVDMNLTRTGLQIQGEPYTKKVEPPLPTKVLLYDEAQLNKICSMKIRSGEVLREKENEFQAFALPTNNTKEIDDFYMKLRLLFPQAKNIVCAFDVPGIPRVLNQDYCDDKLVGAGNFLLNLLKNNRLSHLAIFVVRIQNGSNSGRVRFDMIKKVVQSALKRYPDNKFTGTKQYLVDNPNTGEHEMPSDQMEKARGQRNAESKQRRGQWRQLRGTTRVVSNSQRQRKEHNPEKRRRENSPKQMPWSTENDYHFDFQPPDNITVTKQSYENPLGSSWPTLHQAQMKN